MTRLALPWPDDPRRPPLGQTLRQTRAARARRAGTPGAQVLQAHGRHGACFRHLARRAPRAQAGRLADGPRLGGIVQPIQSRPAAPEPFTASAGPVQAVLAWRRTGPAHAASAPAGSTQASARARPDGTARPRTQERHGRTRRTGRVCSQTDLADRAPPGRRAGPRCRTFLCRAPACSWHPSGAGQARVAGAACAGTAQKRLRNGARQARTAAGQEGPAQGQTSSLICTARSTGERHLSEKRTNYPLKYRRTAEPMPN